MKKLFLALIGMASLAAGLPALPNLSPSQPVTVAPRIVTMSPKLTEQKRLAGKAMVLPEDTNYVYHLAFTWTYDMTEDPDTFVFQYGMDGMSWPVRIATGLATNYTLIVTNWDESDFRHFFSVTAIRGIEESDPSPLTFWPPFPPDHISLSWTQQGFPVHIMESQTLPPVWVNVASPDDGVNHWETNILTGARFFRVDAPGVLNIRSYNPTNAILGR